MLKIGIVGHFGGNQNFTDGQTVKTKEVSSYLENYYKIKIDKYDTYKIKRKIFLLYYNIKKIIKNNDIIILIVSRNGYRIISPIMAKFAKKYNKIIFDIVIGGNRFNIYDNNKKLKKVANNFNYIFVETESMVKEYNKRDINNVKILENFKKIPLCKVEKFKKKDKLKLCTFSRILKEKGIEDAIEAVKLANKKMGKDIFELDIFGIPDKDYEDRFNNVILKNIPSFIKYKGLINPSNSSVTITKYDYMLFLTFWPSEGFPGTIIDAFFANLPVIATDWNCNFDVLKENYTGFKVNVHDIETVSRLLIEIYNNQEKYYSMRSNCYKEAQKYLPDIVMKKIIDEIDTYN